MKIIERIPFERYHLGLDLLYHHLASLCVNFSIMIQPANIMIFLVPHYSFTSSFLCLSIVLLISWCPLLTPRRSLHTFNLCLSGRQYFHTNCLNRSLTLSTIHFSTHFNWNISISLSPLKSSSSLALSSTFDTTLDIRDWRKLFAGKDDPAAILGRNTSRDSYTRYTSVQNKTISNYGRLIQRLQSCCKFRVRRYKL